MKRKVNVSKLKTLMVGLIYPAVLGTCLVLFLYRIFADSWHVLLSFGFYYIVLMILYFSICFLVIFYSDDNKYTLKSFLLDIIEISAILYCVDLLGYYDLIPTKTENLRLFYLTMCFLPPLQLLWRFYTGEMKRIFILPAAIGCLLLLGGALWFYKFIFYNVIIVVLFSILVLYYVLNRLKD